MTTQERNFETGARRSRDADGTRYDLISPIALEAVAATCQEGAEKYGDMNWERGMPVHDLLNHALRHIYKFLSGDRSEPHLPHAAWGLMAAIHSHALWPHLNDENLRSEGCTLGPAMLAKLGRQDDERAGRRAEAEGVVPRADRLIHRLQDALQSEGYRAGDLLPIPAVALDEPEPAPAIIPFADSCPACHADPTPLICGACQTRTECVIEGCLFLRRFTGKADAAA